MHYIHGGTSFSYFKLQQVKQKLQAVVPDLEQLVAENAYFFQADCWDQEKQKKLEDILGVCSQSGAIQENKPLFLVMPRIGTVSPWCSKATDIIHQSGLHDITRIEKGIIYQLALRQPLDPEQMIEIQQILHDPLIESIFTHLADSECLFSKQPKRQLITIPLLKEGKTALERFNQTAGLALNSQEIDYLTKVYQSWQRNPSDAELMMFAQANSEHCRHKMFKAEWHIDGEKQAHSLFSMIKHTYASTPEHVLSAYNDNAAVMEGTRAPRLMVDPKTRKYQYHLEPVDILMKVETHNHPTAISPYPGAATGAGGEIRDEAAVGCGSKPKAGLTGFAVSNLNLPELAQPWEHSFGKPKHFASALQIMLDAPIGAARYNNEFGRPNLCGFFRSYEQQIRARGQNILRGYHKPLMLAGGMGNIRRAHIQKKQLPTDALVIVLGGPSFLIGLGGGAASSQTATETQTDLDFASVQRENAEMQRRCQEVIDSCWSLDKDNPILSIHDVGAGGLSNAIPELVDQSQKGGLIDLSSIPVADSSLSPLEIWCNESQERYVLAIKAQDLSLFKGIAQRENCPFAVVGHVTEEKTIKVTEPAQDTHPIDFKLDALLGHTPRDSFSFMRKAYSTMPIDAAKFVSLEEAAQRILQVPAVADKSFLITIGDRTVGGYSARDQMVGPWQVPVADCAVTLNSYQSHRGEAMAIGERPPIALISPAASARMAVAEAITNITAAPVKSLQHIKLSANWMVAGKKTQERQALFEAVEAIAMKLCPKLQLSIPVGKDSVSMQSQWTDQEGQNTEMLAPLSVVISAFASVQDARQTLTPQWQMDNGQTSLIFIDLGAGQQRLGGSAFLQMHEQLGESAPDIDDPKNLIAFFEAIQSLSKAGKILSYHDRSDGGLWATLCEMAFASNAGCQIDISSLGADPYAILFNEELGAVIQIKKEESNDILTYLKSKRLSYCHLLGTPNQSSQITVTHCGKTLLDMHRGKLHQQWSLTSYHMQALRDNPETAKAEFERLQDVNRPGLTTHLTFDCLNQTAQIVNVQLSRPKVAILREQGVNGHSEMAAAFHAAGFDCTDVHMNDLIAKTTHLNEYIGLAVCGGFSYGDVLGAGRGWAQRILNVNALRDQFQAFFQRPDTFTLGVCNGCQMLAHLGILIPGATHWPTFKHNHSAQFEARLSLVKVEASRSILMEGMAGSWFPVAVSHMEGQIAFSNQETMAMADKEQLVALKYVDGQGKVTEQYPDNPNGSTQGITGLTTSDGRVTIMMPHPERVFRSCQLSWHPKTWGEYSPWFKLFQNAREFVSSC